MIKQQLPMLQEKKTNYGDGLVNVFSKCNFVSGNAEKGKGPAKVSLKTLAL